MPQMPYLTFLQYIELIVGAAVIGAVLVGSKEICSLVAGKFFKKVTEEYMTVPMCMEKRHKCWVEKGKEDANESELQNGILKALILLISYSNIPDDKKNEVFFQLKGLNTMTSMEQE